MSGFRSAICTGVLLLAAGCASSPELPPAPGHPGAARSAHEAPGPSPLLIEVDGGLPLLERHRVEGNTLVASGLELGFDDELVRYRASYALEGGDVFPFSEPRDAGVKAPSVLGSQRFGQNVALQLPGIGGAPLSLGASAEVREQWLLTGETQVRQQGASLEWSPWRATLSLRWSDNATAFDPTLSLNCNVESTLHLPIRAGDTQALRLSGRECTVAGGDWAGVPAQTLSLGYVWRGTALESAARVRVIEPLRAPDVFEVRVEPGYQLGLSHRRDFGALSAGADVTVRQSPSRGGTDDPAGPDDPRWAATASLTWHLPDASLSASLAQGVNPLWFLPQAPEQRDRFGLALDLSPWLEAMAPAPAPVLGLRWDWSELRLPGERPAEESSFRLDLALPF